MLPSSTPSSSGGGVVTPDFSAYCMPPNEQVMQGHEAAMAEYFDNDLV